MRRLFLGLVLTTAIACSEEEPYNPPTPGPPAGDPGGGGGDSQPGDGQAGDGQPGDPGPGDPFAGDPNVGDPGVGDPGVTCNAGNCANGCCDGNTCVAVASQTNATCGAGGVMCAPCVGTAPTCNTSTGVCGCVASGQEADNPNDGIDNDCDGVVDIPQLVNVFPHLDGAAGGDAVSFELETPALANWTLQCRTARPAQIDTTMFTACGGGGVTALPFSAAQSQDDANDGAWVTDIRISWPGGVTSESVRWSYYVHHSLHAAGRCTIATSDEALFTRAAERLATPDAGTFSSTTAHVRNPFIEVEYDPPLASRFFLTGNPERVEMLSLRRRFALSADNRYLLMVRTYESSRIRRGANSSSCLAVTLHQHVTNADGLAQDRGRFWLHQCDAVVLNRAGAGVCLSADTPTSASFTGYFDDPVWISQLGGSYWSLADKVMWRKLLQDDGSTGHNNLRNFSPKCYSAPGCGVQTGFAPALYLPDHDYFLP